jgi:hypothetical protein
MVAPPVCCTSVPSASGFSAAALAGSLLGSLGSASVGVLSWLVALFLLGCFSSVSDSLTQGESDSEDSDGGGGDGVLGLALPPVCIRVRL